jgi:hypothetical protein
MMDRRNKLAGSNPLARPSLDDLTDAMIAPEQGTLRVGSYTLTPTGLVGHSQSVEEWQAVGDLLRRLEGGIQWMLADWLIEGEREYGQTYQMVADLTGYEYGYLRNLVYVAGKLSLRSDKLSFKHHQMVAPLPPDHQRAWIEWAEQTNASAAELAKAMKGTAQVEEKPGAVEKQARTWSVDVTKLARRIDQLDAKDRARVRERAEWLADYYLRIAERAR